MKKRIIICLGLLLALCGLGNAIAILCLGRSTHEFAELVDAHRIQEMRSDLAVTGARVRAELFASLAGLADIHTGHEQTFRDFRQSLRSCGGCHHEPAPQTQLDQIRDVFHAYQEAAVQFAAASSADSASGFAEEAVRRADELAERTARISELASQHLKTHGDEAAASERSVLFVLSGTFVIALGVAAVVALHLKRHLAGPVEELLHGIERVRGGDMTHRISLNADEEFCALATAFNDAYESLRIVLEGMVQAEKMAAVGTLAAGVAHEVNNPLASISSIVQMMRRRASTDEERERIDLILEHIGRISRVSRELLTFARPSTAGQQTRVEVERLLGRAISLLRYDDRARGVQMSCLCDSGPLTVRGNADRLLLVFTNIIVNALDALNKESGTDRSLTITAQEHDDTIAIRFEDNGLGMTQQEIHNAFEPFFTTKEPDAGTGLGLWACREIIEKHGGTIRIDSREGVGTTVTIELPRVLTSDDEGKDARWETTDGLTTDAPPCRT